MTLPPQIWSDLVCTALFGLLLIVLLGFGIKTVDKIWTKLDLEAQVQRGNTAAGVVMASLVLGMCYALATVVRSIAAGS